MNDKPDNRIITSAKEALDIARTEVYEDGKLVFVCPPNHEVCRRLDKAFRDGTFYTVVGTVPTKPQPKTPPTE